MVAYYYVFCRNVFCDMTSPDWMVNFLKAVKEGMCFCDSERTQDSCPRLRRLFQEIGSEK
jgi:hypothetical protein